MSSRGDHQTVPLSVLLKRELASEKVEKLDIHYGEANQSKKGEDYTFIKTECQRVLGDGVTTFHVFAVCFRGEFLFMYLYMLVYLCFTLQRVCLICFMTSLH